MAIDFVKEKERIRKEFEESATFVRITEGQHRVLFLDDGGTPYLNQKWDDKPECIDFLVEENGKQKTLTAKIKSPLYRALIDYAANAGGLIGALLNIKREGEGKKTKYDIVEITRSKPATQEPQDSIGILAAKAAKDAQITKGFASGTPESVR